MAIASAAAACAARRPSASTPGANQPTLVVLLRDEDGTTGRARVSNEFGGVDLSAERQATMVTSAGQPSPVRVMEATEIARLFGPALAALPPAPRRFTLRFRFDSDALTDESRAMLPVILGAVKEFPLPEVAVVGHTDTLGDAKANVALGLKRAMSVERLLVQEGLDASIIAVSSHGEAELDVKTPNNTAEPRNRRVEIVVR